MNFEAETSGGKVTCLCFLIYKMGIEKRLHGVVAEIKVNG